jgi:hypothetical protein
MSWVSNTAQREPEMIREILFEAAASKKLEVMMRPNPAAGKKGDRSGSDCGSIPFSMSGSDFAHRPNQALEPTTTSVTPRAGARVAPAAVVAHL